MSTGVTKLTLNPPSFTGGENHQEGNSGALCLRRRRHYRSCKPPDDFASRKRQDPPPAWGSLAGLGLAPTQRAPGSTTIEQVDTRPADSGGAAER